jgi:glucose/arabinose dehydrogenase
MRYPELDTLPARPPAALATELVAQGFDFPTSVALADDGTLYVAESGLPFGGARAGGRIVRVGPDGRRIVLDGLRQPVNGLTWHAGGFYIAEGGFPGRISRWVPGEAPRIILDGLPGRGNYHTNMVAVRDGWLYFSQGAMTNSGVVGLDAHDLAWLKALPHPFDVPGYDIALAGQTFETDDPTAPNAARTTTAAFAPFGDASSPRARIAGRVPCTAAVLRCRPDGSSLQLFAWGLRNAYGLAFLSDGRLIATDQGADDRGSRPIGNAPDLLYVVEQGRWYGWPDFIGGRPVTDPAFKPHAAPQPQFLLANHAALPPPQQPVLRFAVNAAATKLAPLPKNAPRWPGQLVVALFGDEKPMTAPAGPRVGRRLARIDPRDWSLHALDAGPFTRPIDVHPGPDAGSVLVLDFGQFEMLGKGRIDAAPGSGKLWSVKLG